MYDSAHTRDKTTAMLFGRILQTERRRRHSTRRMIGLRRLRFDRRGECALSSCIGFSGSSRFFALGIIHFMSYATDMVIDDFA